MLYLLKDKKMSLTENNIIDKIEVLENYQNLLNNNSSI